MTQTFPSWWLEWSDAPGILIPVFLSAWLYVRGATEPGHGMARWEIWSFGAGWLALAAALVSPLHFLGETLFSAHMVQHELLMGVAAPLLVLGRPLVPFLWALPPGWRRGLGRASKIPTFAGIWAFLSHPLSAWSLHAVALWAWHAPGLFQATLRSDTAHSLQHATFLGSALLFWWALLRKTGRGGAVLYLFTTAIHTGALGALLTFSPSLWYPEYAGRATAWGLTALEDQQLAGIIMWAPGGLLYTIAGLGFAAAWLRESDAVAAL